MPPKSKEFHRLVREVIAPVLAGLAFSRPRGVGLGGWVREQDGRWLVLWTQLGKWNYGADPEGYTFTVELQLDQQPLAGLGGPRARLYELLTDQERLEHLTIHNEVVAKTGPNPEFLELLLTHERGQHLAEFQPRTAPFGPYDDPWFRYTDVDDVRRWLEFVGRVLPGAIARFAATAPKS